MHAPPKDTSIETLTDPAVLASYDAFLLGIPTRYGNFPGTLLLITPTCHIDFPLIRIS